MQPKSRLRTTLPLVSLFRAAWFSAPLLARADSNTVQLAQFKDPPGEFRGIHWQGFGLNRLTEDGVRARIQSAATNARGVRLNLASVPAAPRRDCRRIICADRGAGRTIRAWHILARNTSTFTGSPSRKDSGSAFRTA